MGHTSRFFVAFFLILCAGTVSFAQAPPRHLHGEFRHGIVELAWDHPESETNPDFYVVYRTPAPDSEWNEIGKGPDRVFIDFSIKNSTLYRYKVTAVYSGNVESDPSNIIG